MKLLIIIPAYNEEGTISKVFDSIPKKIKGIKEKQILVVDDGSTDKTADMSRKHGCFVVSHKSNLGVGKALQSGLEKALEINVDIAVSIDADNQFRAQDIPKIIEPIIKGEADATVGDRFSTSSGKSAIPKNMPSYKYYGNKLMAVFVNSLIDGNYKDVSSGFRAYGKEALLNLNLSGNFTYTQEMFLELSFKGMRIKNVPVKVRYFKGRKSKVAKNIIYYTFRSTKILVRAFRDYKPLAFFLYLSLPFLSVGFMLSAFVLFHYLKTSSFTPYKALAFVGIYSFSVSILLWVVGFLADMFVRIRVNQERIIRLQKQAEINNHK